MRPRSLLRKFSFILMCLAVTAFTPCSSLSKTGQTDARQRTSMDRDWVFHAGNVSSNDQVTSANYDDRNWKRVDLPHDYGLDGPYNPTNSRRNGFLFMDVAWYRKHFVIPKSDEGKVLQ